MEYTIPEGLHLDTKEALRRCDVISVAKESHLSVDEWYALLSVAVYENRYKTRLTTKRLREIASSV
jgi:hypothetical protein